MDHTIREVSDEKIIYYLYRISQNVIFWKHFNEIKN